MSMLTSLNSATMVGTLRDSFKDFTVERFSRSGVSGIDRRAQEKVFRYYPNKPLVLISYRVFDPREPQQVVKKHYFLLLKEDLHKPEVTKQIEDLLSEDKESNK